MTVELHEAHVVLSFDETEWAGRMDDTPVHVLVRIYCDGKLLKVAGAVGMSAATLLATGGFEKGAKT